MPPNPKPRRIEYVDVAAPNGNLRTLPVARIQRVAQSRQDF